MRLKYSWQARTKAKLFWSDSSFGGKCALGVCLDGKLVAAIEREQTLGMFASAGAHIPGAGPNPNGGEVCHRFSDKLRRVVSINLTAGRHSKYR